MKYKLAIINSDSMDCSYGGVAPFLRNMHEGLSTMFEVEYFVISSNLRNLPGPGRLKMMWTLWVRRKELKKFDMILSHVPEGSYIVGHLNLPFVHIFHGNDNPMKNSRYKLGKFFSFIFNHFNHYIDKHAKLTYTVGQEIYGRKKLYNPLIQNVIPTAPEERKGIIFCGRLEKMKNIDHLIYIYSKLPDTFREENPFYIAGSGSLEKSLKNLAKQLGLESQVVFLGNIPNKDIMKEDSTKKIFVMASSYEGFPTAIAEALSVGIPIISTKVGDIPNIITDGKEGRLLDTDFQDNEYIDAIFQIISDYNHYSQAAYHLSALFNNKEITSIIIDDISSLLKKL